MIDVKKTLAKILHWIGAIDDYVVEQGTIYTYTKYRKWNSGKAECWYHRTITGINTQAWASPIYYQDSTVFGTIWNGLFNTAPHSVFGSSDYSQAISIIPNSYNAKGITSLRFVTVGQKSSASGAISIYAEGTWK